jgi:hypothetical protein
MEEASKVASCLADLVPPLAPWACCRATSLRRPLGHGLTHGQGLGESDCLAVVPSPSRLYARPCTPVVQVWVVPQAGFGPATIRLTKSALSPLSYWGAYRQ